MAQFVGSYKYVEEDGNFDALLKKMKINIVVRQVALKTSPTIEISVDDDGTFTVSTKSTFKNSEIKFKLGEEFEEKRMDGVVTRTVVTQDGNKLIQKQFADPEVEIIREFVGNQMITTCKCQDVTCVRHYNKIAKSN